MNVWDVVMWVAALCVAAVVLLVTLVVAAALVKGLVGIFRPAAGKNEGRRIL